MGAQDRARPVRRFSWAACEVLTSPNLGQTEYKAMGPAKANL